MFVSIVERCRDNYQAPTRELPMSGTEPDLPSRCCTVIDACIFLGDFRNQFAARLARSPIIGFLRQSAKRRLVASGS